MEKRSPLISGSTGNSGTVIESPIPERYLDPEVRLIWVERFIHFLIFLG
jgi:hypothetical protein